MKKIIIIGTLHAGITPNEELGLVFEKYKPDQILVEMLNDDIANNNIDDYPPEMVFALSWAKMNDIDVAGFDSDIDVFQDGVADTDNQKLIDQQKKLITKSWTEYNRAENLKLLDIENMNIVDDNKEQEREAEMLNNINAVIADNGTILIVTGCGHLDFFEKNIDKALFPFR